jgi:Holliday junction DNA helicase RuvA
LYHPPVISRIDGILESIDGGRAELRSGDIVYAILVPGVDQQRLARRVGEPITLHTLHYLETSNQGASFTPRLIGFSSASDRAFFELFTTVKGVGNRKAVRALQLPFSTIAEAIAKKDVDLLKSLPEIGKRTAETIVAELAGKVDPFLGAGPVEEGAGRPVGRTPKSRTIADEAVAVLVTLGEPKLQSMQLVQRALDVDPQIATSEALIAAVFRLKSLPL